MGVMVDFLKAGKAKPLISVIVPCHNEALVFSHLRDALVSLANRASKYRFEFILIDDGSRDETWSQIASFASADGRVRGVSLSRNFGHQIALTCGYDLANGDAVVSLDADLQDPPEVIPDLIREWEKGADVVFAVRSKREGEGFFKRWTASLFYRLFNILSETSAPIDAGDFRLIGKRALLVLRSLKEKNRYVRGLVGWIGFRTATVEYERKPRLAGTTKYPFSKMLSFAVDAIISSSSLPLRLTYVFAAIATLPIIAFFVYVFLVHFVFQVPLAPGWSSLIAVISFFGFLILLCLGIMGEYIARIFNETKNRPLYLIRDAIEREGQERSNSS